MGEFTGVVVTNNRGEWRFHNEDGTIQRLTRAKLGEDPAAKEIDLAQYANEQLKVRGSWQHEWLIEAEILEHNPQLLVTIHIDREIDSEELANATQQLRKELLETNVESVKLVRSAEAPDGARVADPVTIGALLIALSASGGVFTQLIGVLHDWLVQDEKRSVTLLWGR
jgi:hypothetical protein